MRMTFSTRLLLILLGLGVAAVGVVGLLSEWPLGTPVLVLVFGLLMVVVGAIGSMPNMNWREGTILWPDPKLYERLDELEKALAEHTRMLTAHAKRFDGEALALDFVLAKLPAPNDDYDSDEQREQDWEQSYEEIHHEISVRQFTGEDYDDGISIQGLEMMLEDLSRDMTLERRRLRARDRFRGRIYDGHNPGEKI